MVKLHFLKNGQIGSFFLLLISLQSFCADNEEDQQIVKVKNITFSCNIPVLNAPLQLERTDASIDKISLALAAVEHGRLLCGQWGFHQSAQEMVIDHALLAAFRAAIGLTSTVCHELGHAIVARYAPYKLLKEIKLGWSPVNILVGSFDYAHIVSSGNLNLPDIEKHTDFEKWYLDMRASYDQCKSGWRDNMTVCAMGPFCGALSAYFIYKGAGLLSLSSSNSIICKLIMFKKVGGHSCDLIPLQHMIKTVIERTNDERKKRKLERIFAELSPLDGDHILNAWNESSKLQRNIDSLNDLYNNYVKSKSNAS